MNELVLLSLLSILLIVSGLMVYNQHRERHNKEPLHIAAVEWLKNLMR